jgi:hypothetical protein
MGDASGWVAAAGLVGLAAFVAGALIGALPRVEAEDVEVTAFLVERRASILLGSLLVISGAALLLWPLAAIGSSGIDQPSTTLGLFSMATWVLGLTFLMISSVAVSALVWRDPVALATPLVRFVLDGVHLATWSLSAPVAAIATVATTVVGYRSGVLPWWVGVFAAAKVASVVVEVVGLGQRSGWNAGGWAAGVSGYCTVGWFASILWSIR